MVMGMDLEPLQDHPNLVHFLNKLFDSSAQNDNSTNAKLLQALDGNPMVELVQGAKFANLAGAAMNPQNAGAALASATLIVRTRNPLDHAHLVRTFSAEAIPALDGFKCYSLSAALENGVKFHFYLCFPDGDDRTAILAQAQQPDLDPLVRRGGDLAPSLAAVLDNVEPSHVWMALTMEPVKPMLGMASMFAAQAPPEVQALLKDLPKSQGVIFQLRLQNNQVRVALGLTFPTEGQTLGFSNALRELWANMIQPQLGALSASAGKAAEELFKGVSIGPKRSAALASTQISFATLKTEYPQLVAMMNQAQQMAASMGGAAGVPGGAAANPNSAAAMDKPEAGSPAMPPSSSGKKSKSNPSAAIGVKEGNRAPEIVGKDLDGKAMKLSDYRGKVVLLDFWAYWCGPCVSMFPHNKELVERYRGQPFVILGVNEDRTPADIQKGNAEHQLTWRSFMDGTASGADRQKITRQYKIEGYPTMMLIDGNGVIRKIIVGAGPNNARLLDQTIEQLVAELR
jgi:thiol-disulfide isomerase/thioredoxin